MVLIVAMWIYIWLMASYWVWVGGLNSPFQWTNVLLSITRLSFSSISLLTSLYASISLDILLLIVSKMRQPLVIAQKESLGCKWSVNNHSSRILHRRNLSCRTGKMRPLLHKKGGDTCHTSSNTDEAAKSPHACLEETTRFAWYQFVNFIVTYFH